jgi:hypothetical protein
MDVEVWRQAHEDIDSLEKAGSILMRRKAAKDLHVPLDHCIAFVVDEVQRRCISLSRVYTDVSGGRDQVLATLAGTGTIDVWQSFYHQVKLAKEFHTRNEGSEDHLAGTCADNWVERAMRFGGSTKSSFSATEANGRFLDMSMLHTAFINLKRVRDIRVKEFVQERWRRHCKTVKSEPTQDEFTEFARKMSAAYRDPDYTVWLKEFAILESLPRYIKYKQIDYERYLETLSQYLSDFVQRQRPLINWTERMHMMKENFEHDWRERNIPGWDKFTCELETYVRETDKLLANENVLKSHKGSKEYMRALTFYNGLSGDERHAKDLQSQDRDKSVAVLEYKIRKLSEMLTETIDETIDMVTRKQARTTREIERELQALNEGLPAPDDDPDSGSLSDSSSSSGEVLDTDDRAIFNPKKLPLGWDGKPIPYWVYKLHGLGHEFKCEICGNHSYWGRRAFDQHFGEARHIQGLRALRILNSVHFHGVTRIEDAIALNGKLHSRTAGAIFNTDKDMECEDAMGNVMSYRAFQDLSRQGLI